MLSAPGSERGCDSALDVAEHRVDGPERRVTSGLATGAGEDRLVRTTRVCNAIETAKSVGDDPGASTAGIAANIISQTAESSVSLRLFHSKR